MFQNGQKSNVQEIENFVALKFAHHCTFLFREIFDADRFSFLLHGFLDLRKKVFLNAAERQLHSDQHAQVLADLECR